MKLLVYGLAAVVVFAFQPVGVDAQCEGVCWVDWPQNLHSVPPEGIFLNSVNPHYEWTSPGDCNGHECSGFAEDAALDSETLQALEELNRGESVSVQAFRRMTDRSPRVVLNRARGALQVYSCDSSHVITHVPLKSEVVRALLEE